MSLETGISRRFLTPACILILFGLNAYIVQNLFFTEFTIQTGSIEAAFVSFSRWLADHWNDSSWLPMWVSGTPSRQVYNPALHHTVALISMWSGWSTPHVYHFITAAAYSLGPVTLFWLCYRWTNLHGFALLTGVIYSLISPAAFLFTDVRQDVGGYFGARRMQDLIQYGEGPHVTGLMLIPIVIWAVDQAASKRRWAFLPIAVPLLAIVPLGNWTTTTGLSLAIAAYTTSKFGAAKIGERPLHWPTFIGLGILAYALACYWIPPSLVKAVQASSAGLDISSTTLVKAAIWGGLAFVLLALHVVFQKHAVTSAFRFWAYLICIAGTVVGARIWYSQALVPIAHRFHLELEMGIAAVGAFLALSLMRLLPRPARMAVLLLFIAAAAWQTQRFRSIAQRMSQAIDFSRTPEYKMAQWFAANMQNHRVFAPGTTSYWMNLYSDVPQFFGCCDQSIRTPEFRMAIYVIYSGDGAGPRDGEIATLWMKAYGLSAVGVMEGSQLGQPFVNPRKFDGLLPELWREPGTGVVYSIPRANDSLAHVIPRTALLSRAPVNGIDVEPLTPFVNALDNPRAPTTFRWINQHEAEVSAQTQPGEIVYVQQACFPGWRAINRGSELSLECDRLGQMVLDPAAAGSHTIRLTYGDSREDRYARGAQVGGLLALVIWTFLARRKQLPA